MAKQNQKNVFSFTGLLDAEINQQNWKEKKKLLQEQFGKFKIALETDLAEAEAQKILDMFNEKLNIQLNVGQVKKDAEAVKKIIETALASINNIDTSALRGIEDTLESIATTTESIAKKMGKGIKTAVDSGIASINKLDDEIKDLKGDLSSIDDAFNFDIKDDATQQLKNLTKLQNNLNKALREGSWLEQQKALVKYAKAYEATRTKFEQDGSYDLGKFDKKYGATYRGNKGRIDDAEINLKNLRARGSGGELIGIDTSALATEATLKKISNKLDNLKINVSGDKSGVDKPASSQKASNDSFVKQVAENFLKDYDVVFDKYGDTSELETKIDELINRVISSLQIKDGFDIKSTLNEATLDGWSSSDLAKHLKGNIFEQINTQPHENSVSNSINEQSLGNAIANALKGVQLNANTQGEVKASIDTTELKNVLHDGTAYDVNVVQDSSKQSSVSSYHAMERGDATQYIVDHYDPELWNNWYSKALDEARTQIAQLLSNDIGLRNAALNQMWDDYKHKTGKNISFDDFINTPIPMYRGSSDKSVTSNAMSFSLDRDIALQNAGGNVDSLMKVLMKPIDTLGMSRPLAIPAKEMEVLVTKEQLAKYIGTQNNGDNTTVLSDIKGLLDSIKTNTDKFVVDDTDPRAETLKQEIQALKTKHPNDLFEAAENASLISSKEEELNKLNSNSQKLSASVLEEILKRVFGSFLKQKQTDGKTVTSVDFEKLINTIASVYTVLKNSHFESSLENVGTAITTLNNTLQQTSARDLAVPVDNTKVEIVDDSLEDNKLHNINSHLDSTTQIYGVDEKGTTVLLNKIAVETEKTADAVRKTKTVEAVQSGQRIISVKDDYKQFEAEEKRIQEKRANLEKDLAQFSNKTLGLGELLPEYKQLEDLLKKDVFGMEDISTAQQLLAKLNEQYNKLTQSARKGTSSMNPFVNMVNGKDKLSDVIRGVELSFQSLQAQPPELKARIDALRSSFEAWLKETDIDKMAKGYGAIKTEINSLKSEISNTNKEQKLHSKSVKELFDAYRRLGELDLQKELATGDERAVIEKEIRGTQMLLGKQRVALGVDKTETDAARAEARVTRDEQIRVANVTKLLALTKELGEQEAKIVKFQEGSQQAQDTQTNISRLQQEIVNIREKCTLTEEELRLLSELEDANKRLLTTANAKQADKEDKRTLNERIKADRKAARVNASNTKLNAGSNILDSLWKIDDDDINVGQIHAVQQLEKALNSLAKAQERADHAIKNNTKDAPEAIKSLKTHSQVVAGLTADVKELISNYERFSGSNATQLGGFAGGDWEQQVTAAIEAQYPGARIKSINHDLKEVTYELKTGARAFTEYTAGVRQADNKIVALKGTTKRLPTFLEGVKKKLGEISQYFSAMSMISKAIQELRKGLQYVKEIDLALTELKKVTDETEETYDKFLDTASKTAAKVGSTIRDVVSSTADWARLNI